MKRTTLRAGLALALVASGTACGADGPPALGLVAYGSEPAWTLHVWSDSISLDTEGDHATHAFATPTPATPEEDLRLYEVAAGDVLFELAVRDGGCDDPDLPLSATLVLGTSDFSGCGREPGLPIVRYRSPARGFEAAVPAGWTERDESRADTAAVTWRAPGEDPAGELTVLAFRLDGGYDQAGLLDLATSFARARYPELQVEDDRTLGRSPGAVRVYFASTSSAAGPVRARLAVDVEQRPGELRLLSLFVPRDDAPAWDERALLLDGFRWLAPPAVPDTGAAPASS
ncbi:MAG: hypothetical protein R3266_05880 [Gemmatimonadota bacterium]|nr:hypothetical protein [Gemmatimonadota bacterium]